MATVPEAGFGGSHLSTVTLGPGLKASTSAKLMAASLVLLAALNLLLPSRVWFVLLVGFGLLLGVSYLWVRSLARNVRLGRRYSRSLIQVGDRLAEDFRLVNTSVLPLPWLELRDHSDLPGYAVGRAMSLGPQADLTWQAGGLCLQRGQFRLGPWEVRLGDPFGLFEAAGRVERWVDLLVYPPIGTAPDALPEKGRSAGERSHLLRASEQTVTAAAVRQYQPGDPPRHVHWPSTLRLGALMVKDFDLDPAGDLWVVMDMEAAVQAGAGPESTEEAAVLAAAAVTARALGQGHAVGLLAYGQSRVLATPARGQMQHWRIMQALATIRAEGEWPLARMVEAERWTLADGAGVVVISTSSSETLPAATDRLRRMGARPSVLVFDAADFGGGKDAWGAAETLAQMGVRHWVIGSDYEFVHLDRREKRRRVAYRQAARWGLESPAVAAGGNGGGSERP